MTDAVVIKEVLLKAYPDAMPKLSDFEVRARPMRPEEVDLKDGHVRIRVSMLSVDPYLRSRMTPEGSPYFGPLVLGEPVTNYCVGVVEASRAQEVAPVGSVVTAFGPWADVLVGSPKALQVRPLPPGVTPSEALTFGGITGLSAYFGLLQVGALREGETVVVTGAAGGTGSVVVQLAKIKGCRVVGIAGSPDKCEWLRSTLHADEAINYRTENVGHRLKELCPKGVDVVFDNVGGDMLDDIMLNMANGGRIACCGSISTYNDRSAARGRRFEWILITRNVRCEGFLVGRFAADHPRAVAEMVGWHHAGKLEHYLDVRRGIEAVPAAFIALFTGSSTGKICIELDSTTASL